MIARLAEQIPLNLRLPNAVLSKRHPRRRFSRRHLDAVTVHPDRAAVQKVAHPPPQRLPKLNRAPGQVARDINDDLCIEPGNPFAKIPGILLRSTVHIAHAERVPTPHPADKAPSGRG